MTQEVQDIIIKALALQRQSQSNVDLVKEEYLKSQDPQVVVRTFEALDKRVDSWLNMGRSAVHGLALDLYQIQNIWELLPTEFTSQWNYSFIEYSCKRTGAKWSTIHNYIGMADTFLSTKKLSLPNMPRDFNPYNIPHSNLILAMSAAKDGKLDKEGWSKLMDPETTFSDLRDVIHKSRIEGTGKPYGYFFVEEAVLWYHFEGKRVPIAELDVEPQMDTDAENKLVEKGIEKLKKVLRVKEGPSGAADF